MDERVHRAAADESGCPLLTASQPAKERAPKKNFLERADDQRGRHRRNNDPAEKRKGEIAVPAAGIESQGEEPNAGKGNKPQKCAASKLPCGQRRTAHAQIAPGSEAVLPGNQPQSWDRQAEQ